MLHSLEFRKLVKGSEDSNLFDPRIGAKIPEKIYALYQEEWKKRLDSFRQSVKRIDKEKLRGTAKLSITSDLIVCQNDYHNVIFDVDICRPLRKGEALAKDQLTLADGGTMPCALSQVLRFFYGAGDVIDVGKAMAINGYRIHGKGVRWSAFDILPPLKYGLDSNIPESVDDLIHSLHCECPSIVLVPTDFLRNIVSNTNQAVVLWGIEKEQFICSDTFTKDFFSVDATSILENLKCVWTFSKL